MNKKDLIPLRQRTFETINEPLVAYNKALQDENNG